MRRSSPVQLLLTGQADLAHLRLRHHLLMLVLVVQLLLQLGRGLLGWGGQVGGVVGVGVPCENVRGRDLDNFFGRRGFDCGGAAPL